MLNVTRFLSLIFLSLSAYACANDSVNSGSSGGLRPEPELHDTTITLENGEELTGGPINVDVAETGPQGTLPGGSFGIHISATSTGTSTGTGAGIAVDFIDAQLLLQGSWETRIGVGNGLAQAGIGDALVPAGIVRYTRADGRISGKVENDPDAASDFPSEAKTTDQGMTFTGRFILTCSVSIGGSESGAFERDETLETPFCQQFADLGQLPSTPE